MKLLMRFLIFCLCTFISASTLLAQSPRSFSYQGSLLDAAKKPVTGVHHLTVKLYDTPVEGAVLHSENFTSQIENGIFNVILGSETALESAIAFDKEYWLGVSIDNGAELSPRTALTSIPYAIHADAASSLTQGAKGAVTSMNGKSGNLTIKGGGGTDIQTEGNTITITSNPVIISSPQGSTQVAGTANQVLANGTSGSFQSGNVTLTTPQDIHTGATPQFVNLNLSGIPSGSSYTNVLVSNGGVLQTRTMSSLASGVTSLTGTVNQVNVSSPTGNVTLSLPQNINSGATPTFAGVTLSSMPASSSSTNVVVSNGGSLETRSFTSLASPSWSLTGNSGTTPGTNFIGTTDNKAFEIHIFDTDAPNQGSKRVMRYEPNAISPNLIGGSSANTIDAGVVGATIAGGGIPGIYINRVAADWGTIGGGKGNYALGSYSTIGGGSADSAVGQYATVAGGVSNTARALGSFVGGGSGNVASGNGSFVGGGGVGGGNQAVDNNAVVVGGVDNLAGNGSFVGGGDHNLAPNSSSTVVGGTNNRAGYNGATNGGYGRQFMGGGVNNTSGGDAAIVVGGINNTAGNHQTFVGGGSYNVVGSLLGTIVGGDSNLVEGNGGAGYGGILGGHKNQVGYFSAIGAGDNNSATTYCFIGGGSHNDASNYTVVTGGLKNSGPVDYGFIGGGSNNRLGASYSTIGGGLNNEVANNNGVIGGGENDTVTGDHGVVAGGLHNVASGSFSSVGSGRNNRASGLVSIVVAGEGNFAIGDGSFIGGGDGNYAFIQNATIVGGEYNRDSAFRAVICAGASNSIYGQSGFIGAGELNKIELSAGYGVIGGGYSNRNAGFEGVICGGDRNVIDGRASGFIGAGFGNFMRGEASAIVAGDSNRNTDGENYAFIGGGHKNTVASFAVVGGGSNNFAAGTKSVVAGGENNYTNSYSSIPGGRNLSVSDHSFGFNGDNSSNQTQLSFASEHNLAYFGNVDLWLGNVDNTARGLRFYSPNTTYDYSGANYTAFKAQVQSANITYTLPASLPVNNGALTTTNTGTLSWASHGQAAAAIGAVQVINDAAVTANSTIIVTIEGTVTYGAVTARNAGVSFTVTTGVALVATDVINYQILP